MKVGPNSILGLAKTFDIAIHNGNETLAYTIYRGLRGLAIQANTHQTDHSDAYIELVTWAAGRLGEQMDNAGYDRMGTYTGQCAHVQDLGSESLLKHYYNGRW